MINGVSTIRRENSIISESDFAHKGLAWFEQKFLHVLTPITIIALLLTLILLFSFKGDVIIENPLTILWTAIPLALQTILIFSTVFFKIAFALLGHTIKQ